METANLLLPLACILILAKLVALGSKRFGLPAVFGELMVGILIGPAVLGFIHATDFLKIVAQLGVIMLMFIAGLETDLDLMRKVGKAAFLTASAGVVTPLALGTLAGIAFGLPLFVSLFLGTALTATSVSISAETLQELGKLRTRAGTTILGAAVIDDVMGVIVLALVLGVTSGANIVFPLTKMILFFGIAIVIGIKILPWLNRHLLKWHAHTEEAVLAVVLALALVYSWAAEELGGVAAITGAYLLGVLLSRLEIKSHLEKGVRSVGYGFFIPIFFVDIGLQADFAGLMNAALLTLVVAGLAVVSKIIGCGLGAWAGRLKRSESVIVGVGMISRGEVALVIAALGFSEKLISSEIFSIVIFMTVFTTLVTPLLLKLTYILFEGKQPKVIPATAPAIELDDSASVAA